MTRKVFFYSLPMVMAAMMMAACSNEDVPGLMGDNIAQVRSWQVSINAGPAAGTRAISVGGNNGQTLYTNWDANDAVEVVKGGVSVGTLHADVSAGNSAYATLTGTLTGTFSVGDEVTLYYHSAALDFTGQVGTLAGVSTNKSYLTATSTVKSVDGSGGFLSMSDAAFSAMQAYLDLSFVFSSSPISINRLDIWADGGKLVKTKAIDGTTTYATEAAPLTITPATATNKFFIALRDENGAANILHFKATASDNTYIYEGSKDFKFGKFYAGTVTMSAGYRLLSTATTADIGKVVCASGHLHDAKTAVPAGHTAVGILGKVSATGHGRILALKNAMWQLWPTIDGWTQWVDLSLLNDPNLLSDINYYNFLLTNTWLRLLPDDDARNGLPSYTILGTTVVSNWGVAQKYEYNEIFTNLGSTTGDENGKTFDANVNAYITGAGGTAMGDNTGFVDLYWSATTTGNNTAWGFTDKVWDSHLAKGAARNVRPVLGF